MFGVLEKIDVKNDCLEGILYMYTDLYVSVKIFPAYYTVFCRYCIAIIG